MALLHVDFFSDVLEMGMNMDVILPQQTKNQIGLSGRGKGNGKYPTLYLLHGKSDDHTAWQRRSSIERYVSGLGLAVVMPTTHLGWYTDTRYGMKYWTFISRELPMICRSFFPNMSDRKEDTFAAGLSMGGYGAFKLALGAPDTFGAAASLSGILNLASRYRDFDISENRAYWEGVFGPLDKVGGSENDLFYLAEKRKDSGQKLPPLYIWCGQEDRFFSQSREASVYLKGLGYDVTYRESPGDHSWDCWDEQIKQILAWLPINNGENI